MPSSLARACFLLILAAGTGVIWYFVLTARPSVLTVAFLDVGQGDAVFIESPTGNQMLVDGGRDAQVLQQLPRLMGVADRSIDLVVATHPDADHIGGLPDVFERYGVGMYIESGNQGETATFKTLEEDVSYEGATRMTARSGSRIVLGGGVYADILFPDRDVSRFASNDASIVLRVVYGDTAFMLTGDAPVATERIILGSSSAVRSDVLKAGHHGSRTSSSASFIDAVSPAYAVFSRGCDNTYGHPHADVVARFTARAIRTLDTCTEGTVVFSSDGQQAVLR